MLGSQIHRVSTWGESPQMVKGLGDKEQNKTKKQQYLGQSNMVENPPKKIGTHGVQILKFLKCQGMMFVLNWKASMGPLESNWENSLIWIEDTKFNIRYIDFKMIIGQCLNRKLEFGAEAQDNQKGRRYSCGILDT